MGESDKPLNSGDSTNAESGGVNLTNASSARGLERGRMLLLVVGPLCFLVACLFFYLKSGRYVETDNAYLKADVIPISAEVSAMITDVNIRENQHIEQGELLFSLDPESFQVDVDKAAAQLADVCAELTALQTSYEEKNASIELEKPNLDFALRELNRKQDLKGKNFVSASELDDLQHAVNVSRQQLRVMQLDLKRIEASLGGDVKAPLEKYPKYLSAQASLNQAKLNLKRAEVRAPVDGIVSQVPFKGQYVRAGSIVTALVSSEAMWIEANFTETDLTNVREGQVVDIHIDTYPDRTWQGEVISVSPATGSEFSILPQQNATGNWVKIAQRVPVRISIQIPGDAPPLRVGLSAVVTIDTEHKKQLLGMSL